MDSFCALDTLTADEAPRLQECGVVLHLLKLSSVDGTNFKYTLGMAVKLLSSVKFNNHTIICYVIFFLPYLPSSLSSFLPSSLPSSLPSLT